MDRYPYSIVWTPLPIITWILPLIGHMGIADSDGVIRDFGGSYYVAVDNFTFGRVTKFARLDPSKARKDWNAAVHASAQRFCQKTHNIFYQNCHSHVADTLNEMEYEGHSDWDELKVWWLITTKSEYVSLNGFLNQWALFLLTIILIVILIIIF